MVRSRPHHGDLSHMQSILISPAQLLTTCLLTQTPPHFLLLLFLFSLIVLPQTTVTL